MEATTEAQRFREFIIANDHPCLMAQGVFKQENYLLKEFGPLGQADHAPELLASLGSYIEQYDFQNNNFYTFIAVFAGEAAMPEEVFEKRLWQELQNLHDIDEEPWDPEVSDDPQDHQFSVSLAGRAFYVVGLHPNSSRMSRRYHRPALVFNLHWQFEQLRELGSYQQTRDAIRERDRALQGSVNPMLEDFGHDQEARQYSGRAVSKSWQCPFHSKHQKQTS